MSFPFLFGHLFWFHLTCHIPHKSASCFQGIGDTDREFVSIHLYLSIMMVRSRGMPLNSSSEALSWRLATLEPEATPPNHIRTLTYVKSIIDEQHRVLIPWVYFLIKCLDNRCLWYAFTNNASSYGWPVLVLPWYSQISLAQGILQYWVKLPSFT